MALGVIGHIDAAELDRLLTRLAAALAPGAPFVVELQPPDQPIAVPRSRFARERVGQLVQEGWQEAEPAGPDVLRWTMTFRTLRDGEPIAETVAQHPFRTIGRDELAAAARPPRPAPRAGRRGASRAALRPLTADVTRTARV